MESPSSMEKKRMPYPRKKHYRQRAHVNPLSINYFKTPETPTDMDWAEYYPIIPKLDDLKLMPKPDKDSLLKVEILDVGCGFGGLLEILSNKYPKSLILGLEIRLKVSEYVKKRIEALRANFPGEYNNIACIRTNAMQYLSNYFYPQQLKKMFFLYPDPHFKKSKHKWRIISPKLIKEYAKFLKPQGRIFLCTDVKDLFEWMLNSFKNEECSNLFRQLSEDEMAQDDMYDHIGTATQEGQKVNRNNGSFWRVIFERTEEIVETTIIQNIDDKLEQKTNFNVSQCEISHDCQPYCKKTKKL